MDKNYCIWEKEARQQIITMTEDNFLLLHSKTCMPYLKRNHVIVAKEERMLQPISCEFFSTVTWGNWVCIKWLMSVRFAAVNDVHLLLWSLQKISQFRRFGVKCHVLDVFHICWVRRHKVYGKMRLWAIAITSIQLQLLWEKKPSSFLSYPNSFNIHYKSRFLCLRKLANNVIFTARNGK